MEDIMPLNEEEIKETLDKHSDEIAELKLGQGIIKVEIDSIKKDISNLDKSIIKLENTVLTTSNSSATTSQAILQHLNNIDNNKTSIALKVISLISALVLGFVAAKYGVNIAP